MINPDDLKSTRKIERIIIHCSATREGQDVKTETIKDWHVNGNGWSDIGYHFVIELDGSIQIGRDINRTGSHAKGYNTGSIGICYVGGFDADLNPKDTKNDKQNAALAAMIVHLQGIYGDVEFLGHCDLPGVAKACPSFDVADFIHNLGKNLFADTRA